MTEDYAICLSEAQKLIQKMTLNQLINVIPWIGCSLDNDCSLDRTFIESFMKDLKQKQKLEKK